MESLRKFDAIRRLPKFEELTPYWKRYFQENDSAIQENFWGNLSLLKNAEDYSDPYIRQQKEMGYCFTKGSEAPATFYQALSWVFENLHRHINQGNLTVSDVLWPARVFEVQREDGSKEYLFRVIGEGPPENSLEVSIVKPYVFAEMISEGLFPMGSSFRAHTNQTLAEHDLAHYGGFISSPAYMRAIREGFRRVCDKMKRNPRVREALENFDSIYSLRLYYMIEIFTLIPDTQKKGLQELLEIPLEEPINLEAIIQFLKKKAKTPALLYKYLYRIYDQFPGLVNPAGGESRDILNRVRKFNRGSGLGVFFSQTSNLDSKFDGSSIYSLYQNGLAALENKRSTHPDFLATLCEIHAPFIGTLIGTSQLTVEDWVLQAVEELPNPKSKLYQYLCKSGGHLI